MSPRARPTSRHRLPDKARAPPEVLRKRPENRTVSGQSALAGSVCRFEPVRGTRRRRGDSAAETPARPSPSRISSVPLRIGRHASRTALKHRATPHESSPPYTPSARAETDFLGRTMAAVLHFKGRRTRVRPVTPPNSGTSSTQRSAPSRRPSMCFSSAATAEPVRAFASIASSTLARQDIRWRHGIPVTSPARAFLDLAAIFDDFELEAALAAAFRRNARSSIPDRGRHGTQSARKGSRASQGSPRLRRASPTTRVPTTSVVYSP